MKKLIVFPSDPMQAYLNLGQTYEYYEDYFNPGAFFEEVYALSPWGNNYMETHGRVTYIKEKPKNFKNIVADLRPDVVRAYGGYRCADWLAMSMIDEIPTIVSVHDTNPALIFNSIKYTDNVIYMAKCVQQAVRKKVDVSDKGEWVMGNRVDVKLFSSTSNAPLEKELNEKFGKGRHILHVGRKSNQKNLDTLIKSLKYLPKDVSVIFVGKGDFSPYKKIADSLGLSERVYNVDHVANKELPVWYSWCDCFCTPSRWEGFGFVFIEAASCKAPIVTSDIAPMNEYLTNKKDSILVKDYENPEAIANAVSYVFDNKSEVDQIKKNAREVGEHFSKEAVDAQEIEIYKQVIKAGPKNRRKMPFLYRKKLEWKYRNF